MASAREIQSRMKSIQDTMKITNAMYMISSSKMQKAKKSLSDTEPLFYAQQEAVAKFVKGMPETHSIYFGKKNIPEEEKKRGYIVITARPCRCVQPQRAEAGDGSSGKRKRQQAVRRGRAWPSVSDAQRIRDR